MKKKWLILVAAVTVALSGCSVKEQKTSNVVSSAVPTKETVSAVPLSTANATKSIESAFTQADQHPEKLLIGVIDSAKTSLDIAIYSLTYPDIVSAIKRAKQRGVDVRIITDEIQSKGKSQIEALKILGSSKIPMKQNKHSGLMHLKVTIADNKVVTTGSYNYSKAASTTNDEVLLVIRDETIAKSFEEQFQRMWNDTKGFESLDLQIAQ